MIYILAFSIPTLLIIVLSFILTVFIYRAKKEYEAYKHETQ